ncbi:hypothetical protein ES706_01027 [subsurface metagenome]
MNIVQLCSAPPPYGGVTIYGHETSKELVRLGHRVFMLPLTKAKKIDPDYQREINYEIVYCDKFFNFATLVDFILFSFRLLRRKDAILHKSLYRLLISRRSLKSVLGNFYLLSFVYWICVRNKIDILMGHHASARGMIALIVGKMLNIPAFVFVHGGAIFFDENTTSREKALTKWVLSKAYGLLFCSNNSISRALELGADRHKIYHVGLGVDASKYRCKEKRTKSNYYTIGFLGNLFPYRGLEELIISSFKIVQKIPNLRIILAGPDPLRYWNRLRALIDKVNLGNFVEYWGEVTQDKHKKFLCQLDVMALLIKGKKTGSLPSCLEAQSVGVPVLTTGSGGVDEYILPGKTGFICGQGVNKICNGLLKIYEYYQKDLWDHNLIKEWALDHSWRKVALNMEKVFKNSKDCSNINVLAKIGKPPRLGNGFHKGI